MKLPECKILPNLLDSIYDASGLVFADTYTYKEWVSCREEFHPCLKQSETFHFKCRKYITCIKRIKKLEEKLNIKHPAKFYKVIYNGCFDNVIYVKFGKFWSRNSMRKSIFTAVLKSKKYFQYEPHKSFLDKFIDGYRSPSKGYNNNGGVIDNILCGCKLRK